MRILFPLVLTTACLSQTAMAEDVFSSQQALNLALEAAELSQSETIRIQSLESSLYPNGFQDWGFDIRQGPQIFDAKVAQDGTTKINIEADADSDKPDFWANLPVPSAIDQIEDMYDLAKAELIASAEGLRPRDQYLARYEVCDVPSANETDIGQNGCKDGEALEEWSIVLKVDVEGEERPKNYVVIFEDGVVSRIGGVRVGGNW